MSVIALCAMAIGFTSCQQQNQPTQPTDQEPAKPTSVNVTNNTGSLSLNSFTIVFINRADEVLGKKDFGDLNPGNSASMSIPVGAERFYMGAYVNHGSDFLFSPYYYLDQVTSLSITYDMVQTWSN